MRVTFKFLTVLTLLLIASSSAFAQQSDWKAGIARVVITPEQPVWMAGYASRSRPSEGKVHDLYGRALALQDKRGNRVVIVTTDFLDAEQQAAVVRTTNWTVEKIIAAVGLALKQLQPAVLSFGRGEATFGMNRRVEKNNRFVFGANKDGVKDDDVPVLRVASPDGSLRAVLFSYACHNTTLPAEFYQFNGDYAGYAEAELEKANPGATAMFMMGCGADVGPQPTGKVEFASEHGKVLAASVSKVLAGSMVRVSGGLKTKYERIPLPLNVLSREELRAQLRDKDKYRRAHAERWLARWERDGKVMTEYPYPLQVIQFGNVLTFVAMSGEVVVDYALRLKRDLGTTGLWVTAYCNDVMAYIPSVRILKEGGYEPDFSMMYYDLPGFWNLALEETIIRKVHELTRQVGRNAKR